MTVALSSYKYQNHHIVDVGDGFVVTDLSGQVAIDVAFCTLRHAMTGVEDLVEAKRRGVTYNSYRALVEWSQKNAVSYFDALTAIRDLSSPGQILSHDDAMDIIAQIHQHTKTLMKGIN